MMERFRRNPITSMYEPKSRRSRLSVRFIVLSLSPVSVPGEPGIGAVARGGSMRSFEVERRSAHLEQPGGRIVLKNI